MNQYGIKPASRVVMLGAGNIGLIVSYQLLQAGVKVSALAEGSPIIGGYLVHAAKLRRMGVPIFTSHTIKSANGDGKLESVTIWEINTHWQGIPGTERTFPVDALCIAVGLSPLAELLWQAGCKMKFVPALGGYVPYRDKNLQTSQSGIFVAGDAAGVEEATSAMVNGQLAGFSAAEYLGCKMPNINAMKQECHEQLNTLRHGPAGGKIASGLAAVNFQSGETTC